ncbi:glycosyltransferase family 4 protein [Flavivirga aquimarina]|uniref:Glycosyltransferase family 4 protein n=1 Tax=Flavivirga aquimarina TaxID=2027862 RepID=A0ABT8WBX4_9FLAO|nr:glycosyltransferase family 4 protein [Flavivirga aquimarina]MDO5970553.1 glycosyltransferase family 4 protein [Flavivirga aquimarina]
MTPKTKNIAIVCNYTLQPDRIGGMDRFYIAFDKEVKEKGYHTNWFFSKYEAFEFYKELNIHTDNKSSVERFFMKHCEQNDIRYDIVITHFTELCTPFYKWVKQKHKGYIVAVDHNPRPLNGFPIKKRMKNWIKGLFYSKYIDQFIAVSEYTKKHILNDYGHFLASRVPVVRNGIACHVFKKRTTDQSNKFIVASHLRPSKGIQDLIKAVSMLSEEVKKEIHIDIYGEGSYEDELKELSMSLNLDDCIHFKGSSPLLSELFCNYNFMLQPTYMECFSLSILESLSANVPVVTTQVGGNLEVITHSENGYIYPAGNIEDLAEIINNIVLKKYVIKQDVSKLVEEQYYLDKMVKDHINLLPCT